jgi:hypothetical protein
MEELAVEKDLGSDGSNPDDSVDLEARLSEVP